MYNNTDNFLILILEDYRNCYCTYWRILLQPACIVSRFLIGYKVRYITLDI